LQIQELVGSKVYVKQRFAGEHQGRILSVPMAVELSDVEASVNGSIFRIALASGDVVETSGFNLTYIGHAGYMRESARSGNNVPQPGRE
jgi:hypothetical protein